MKKIGLGVQEFSELKRANAIYVDKTKIIHQLIEQGKYYFFSRPRRFGKSVLINTMLELFKGNRELFEDCWIYDQWNWEETFPVLHFSFAKLQYRELGLKKALDNYIVKLASGFGVKLESTVYSEKFLELIEKLGEKKQVVILIDEYDKPIIDYLEKSEMEQAKENQEIMKTFYSGIKDEDKHIHFLFITGVSKFSQVSIFSDLNHLTDTTIHNSYGTLVGYTEEEIKKYYPHYLEITADFLKISQAQLLEKIKEWYNGYSWDGIHFLYNPYSLLRLFDGKAFKNYWFSSGTPTFLMKKLKETGSNIHDSVNQLVKETTFNTFDVENLNLTALLFQTGYLTIKKINPEENTYILDFPNKEVRESFLDFAVEHYANSSQGEMDYTVESLLASLKNQDMDAFLLSFQTLFSSITSKQLDYVQTYEGFYHSIIFIVLKMLGIHIRCEVQSSFGATDAVVKTKNTIYVLEFKRNLGKKGALTALNQIKTNKYYEPYLIEKEDIIIAGISFEPEEKNLIEILHETIEK